MMNPLSLSDADDPEMTDHISMRVWLELALLDRRAK
jgi:hypothetical protein